jgi:predicted component of type VI protein secretion system
MTLPTALITTVCLLSGVLTGCSTDRFSQSNDKTSELAGESSIGDKIKDMISSDNDDLQSLKGQLEKQQQQLETMLTEQQALQQQLKRQQVTLTIKPSANANAGRAKQGTASTAYIAFLEEESEFTDIESLAAKEVSVVPNRESNLTLNIPQNARFIAVKVGLRYTKKRSQFLIPITSLNFDTPLTLNIGACDVSIVEGISPEQAPTFTTKLKYYQQPLVSCS